MAFFASILTIFFSMMAFQNLSTGSDPEAENPIVTPTPSSDPFEEGIVPNEDSDTEEPILLTNKQKYFETLVNPNSTNIMLLGTEPTGFNFDTIMILNIDKISKKMQIISLPRDIYIDYSEYVLDALAEKKPSYLKEKGFHRINAAPSIGNAIEYKGDSGRFKKPYVDFIADIIEEVFEIHVDDYAYVKVNGFRNIVDYFGKVTVYVPVLMDYKDPTQDFEVYLEKGTQPLDGKEAEGYVRFRQGYDENGVFHNYGDLFRKENQSRFIKAFITQHVTLKNLSKLSKISEVISANVITSVKGWDRIVEYGALAEEALKDNYPINNVELKLTEKTIEGSSYVILKTKE